MTALALPGWARQESKPAQPSTPPATGAALPSGEELFKKHVAALGGEEALRAEKNRVTKGRIQIKGQPNAGQVTVLRVAPNRMYSTLDLPGIVTIETWYNGERGWVRDSNSGVRALSGADLAETKRSADMLGEANFKERYTAVRTIAREKFEGKDAYSVEATISPDNKRTMYFDAESGLLSGIRVPSGKGPENDILLIMSDYKQFGAVKQPTKVTQRAGPGETVTTFTSIDANVAPMKSVDPPDEIKSVK
jgi:hypothetical protein